MKMNGMLLLPTNTALFSWADSF